MSNPALISNVVFHVRGYKHASKQLFVLIIVAVIVVLSLLPEVFRDSSFLLLWLFFIAIIVFSIAKVDRMLRWTRLILSPQGVEYYAYNFQLSSTWEDI